MFQTELARAITDLGLGTGVVTTPAPAARGGRVIAPAGPHPPQLGGDSPVYDDGVLRITRLPGPGPGAGPGPGLARAPAPAPVWAPATRWPARSTSPRSAGCPGSWPRSPRASMRSTWTWPPWTTATWPGCGSSSSWPRMAAWHVVLHHVPAHLRAIMGIVGWDTAPGVELAS